MSALPPSLMWTCSTRTNCEPPWRNCLKVTDGGKIPPFAHVGFVQPCFTASLIASFLARFSSSDREASHFCIPPRRLLARFRATPPGNETSIDGFAGDGDDPPSAGVNCELHRPITWRDWDSERHRVQQVLDSR